MDIVKYKPIVCFGLVWLIFIMGSNGIRVYPNRRSGDVDTTSYASLKCDDPRPDIGNVYHYLFSQTYEILPCSNYVEDELAAPGEALLRTLCHPPDWCTDVKVKHWIKIHANMQHVCKRAIRCRKQPPMMAIATFPDEDSKYIEFDYERAAIFVECLEGGGIHVVEQSCEHRLKNLTINKDQVHRFYEVGLMNCHWKEFDK